MLPLLTLLDDQISYTKMGKTELFAGCVDSLVNILSQRLVIQCHNNDTLPDLAKVLQNNPCRFYCDLTLKPSLPVSPSILCWRFILLEWSNKHIRKAI